MNFSCLPPCLHETSSGLNGTSTDGTSAEPARNLHETCRGLWGILKTSTGPLRNLLGTSTGLLRDWCKTSTGPLRDIFGTRSELIHLGQTRRSVIIGFPGDSPDPFGAEFDLKYVCHGQKYVIFGSFGPSGGQARSKHGPPWTPRNAKKRNKIVPGIWERNLVFLGHPGRYQDVVLGSPENIFGPSGG